MALTWKLVDENDELIQMVNCQYDSLDFSQYSDAIEVIVDFKNETTKIIKRNT